MYFIDVLLPRPLSDLFTYSISEHISLGTLVLVEFRKKTTWAVVFKCYPQSQKSFQVHPVKEIGPCIGKKCLEWILVEAQKNFVHSGVILNLILRKTILPYNHKPINHTASIPLSDEQSIAVNKILESNNTPCVLYGKTGSGKTRVYLEVVQRALAENKQILVLVPEIMFTTELKKTFADYFGFDCFVWHSKLSQKVKNNIWAWAVSGKAGVVIGARSALFLPFISLGLIVIDEEHDLSYKQEVEPRYHARTSALQRAQIWDAKILLVSATPSVETINECVNKNYRLVQLSRAPKHDLAEIVIAPISSAPVSDDMLTAISKNASEKLASFLLVNRRGYAAFAMCKACKNKIMCGACSVACSWHNSGLKCHWCGRVRRWPEKCSCGEKSWIPIGWGLERIYEWIKEKVPELRIECVSSDTPKSIDSFKKLKSGELDLIIGTQVISQGHNIPNVSFVGMIDISHSANFRSYEHLYQLMMQTRGRAGRFNVRGYARCETDNPNNYVYRNLDDHKAFYREEINRRKKSRMPPFSCLLAIIITGKTIDQVKRNAEKLSKIDKSELEIWGPSPAPILKIRNVYRYRMLIRGKKEDIARFVQNAKAECSKDLDIDPDPHHFY